MSKTIFRTLLSLLLVCSLLWACTPAEPSGNTTQPTTAAPQSSYAGTMEGYEYFHTDARDRAWEEDVLHLAEAALAKHPLLTRNKCYTYNYYFEGTQLMVEYGYDNSLCNEQLRSDFIASVNSLIVNIPVLNDVQILFELQKLFVPLADSHSSVLVTQACTMKLPIFLEAMATPDGFDYLLADVLVEQEELLHTKLVSINGVSVDEIVAKLSVYESGESDAMTALFLGAGWSWIIQKEALQVIGVVAESDKEAELVVTTGNEQITCTLPFVPKGEYLGLDWMWERLADQDIPRYRHSYEVNYWYEVLDADTLYIRFFQMGEDSQQSMNAFVSEITKTLRASEMPMDIIIDFRDNSGGYSMDLEDLTRVINQYSSGLVHILIDEATASASVTSVCKLQQTIPNTILIGAPAAQGGTFYSGWPGNFLPNSGYEFKVSEIKIIYPSKQGEAPIMPDLTIYQDWEDYRNGVDTVLEYVLDFCVVDKKEAP